MTLIAEPVLVFHGKLEACQSLKSTTGDMAVLVMLITSGLAHLPPMKVVTILSGVIGFSLALFILSGVVARSAKFFVLGWVLSRYGGALADVIARRFAWMAIGVTLALAALWLAVKTL